MERSYVLGSEIKCECMHSRPVKNPGEALSRLNDMIDKTCGESRWLFVASSTQSINVDHERGRAGEEAASDCISGAGSVLDLAGLGKSHRAAAAEFVAMLGQHFPACCELGVGVSQRDVCDYDFAESIVKIVREHCNESSHGRDRCSDMAAGASSAPSVSRSRMPVAWLGTTTELCALADDIESLVHHHYMTRFDSQAATKCWPEAWNSDVDHPIGTAARCASLGMRDIASTSPLRNAVAAKKGYNFDLSGHPSCISDDPHDDDSAVGGGPTARSTPSREPERMPQMASASGIDQSVPASVRDVNPMPSQRGIFLKPSLKSTHDANLEGLCALHAPGGLFEVVQPNLVEGVQVHIGSRADSSCSATPADILMRPSTEADWEAVREQITNGISQKECARKLKMSMARLKYVCRKHGLLRWPARRINMYVRVYRELLQSRRQLENNLPKRLNHARARQRLVDLHNDLKFVQAEKDFFLSNLGASTIMPSARFYRMRQAVCKQTIRMKERCKTD